jgi:hypothetical protein
MSTIKINVKKFKKLYPIKRNIDLAKDFGLKEHQVPKVAAELGLRLKREAGRAVRKSKFSYWG